MARTNSVLAVGAGLFLLLDGAAHADSLLPPPLQVEGVVSYREPYRVEGLVRHRDPHAIPGNLEGPFVAVDIGPARTPLLGPDAWPDLYATIVGTQGHVRATWHDLVRTCEYPCGPSESEVCHFTTLYRTETPVAEIGTPLVAIEGRQVLENFRPASGRPASLESLSLEPGLADTALTAEPRYGFRDWSDDGRRLTVASDRAQLDGIEWQGCSAVDHGQLQHLQCGPANGALLSEGRPVLVSMEHGRVSVFATFNARGQTYALVQRGPTAGLLANTEQGWRALLSPVRHALTCG